MGCANIVILKLHKRNFFKDDCYFLYCEADSTAEVANSNICDNPLTNINTISTILTE